MKKVVVLVLGLIASGSVWAAENCNPYLVNINESEIAYVYPCGQDYTVQYGRCTEGEVAYFATGEYTGENQVVEEARVCRNGRFFPKTKAPKARRCVEGSIGHDSVYNGEQMVEVTTVCRAGRYVRAN